MAPYRSSDLLHAISLIRNRKMSVRAAALEAGVPRSTLYDHAYGKHYRTKTEPGRRGARIMNVQEEHALCVYAKYMGDRNHPLNQTKIRTYAKEIISKSRRKTRMGKSGPCYEWVQSFIKRHPDLAVKKPRPLEKSRASVEKEDIQQYFELLEKTLTDLGLKDKPERVFNCDETGFSGKEHSRVKVVVDKKTPPYQQSVNISGHITVNMTVSADGKTLPPLIIFSKSYPACDYKAGVPANWMFEHSPTGYINNNIFVRWFKKIFLKNCGHSRPVVLLMDNHASHITPELIDLAIENEVELICFPAHATHLVQPLDIGFFGVLKRRFVELTTSLGFTAMKTLPRHMFPNVLKLAMDKIAPNVATGAFRSSGIFPLQPSKVINAMTTTSTVNAPVVNTVNDTTQSGSSHNNILVALGLIPVNLGDILVVPPVVPNITSKRAARCKKARVITKRVVCADVHPVPPVINDASDDELPDIIPTSRKIRSIDGDDITIVEIRPYVSGDSQLEDNIACTQPEE